MWCRGLALSATSRYHFVAIWSGQYFLRVYNNERVSEGKRIHAYINIIIYTHIYINFEPIVAHCFSKQAKQN